MPSRKENEKFIYNFNLKWLYLPEIPELKVFLSLKGDRNDVSQAEMIALRHRKDSICECLGYALCIEWQNVNKNAICPSHSDKTKL